MRAHFWRYPICFFTNAERNRIKLLYWDGSGLWVCASDYIAHIHTAGVPGRAELDENQEVNYPGVMRAPIEIGYDGYVAQEFIPTWSDKALALRHAAKTCDV